MPSTNPPSLLALLHRLKGPPLACLVALGIANGAPVSAAWVGVVTGYSPETARQALQRLKELQLDEPGQLRLAEQPLRPAQDEGFNRSLVYRARQQRNGQISNTHGRQHPVNAWKWGSDPGEGWQKQ